MFEGFIQEIEICELTRWGGRTGLLSRG